MTRRPWAPAPRRAPRPHRPPQTRRLARPGHHLAVWIAAPARLDGMNLEKPQIDFPGAAAPTTLQIRDIEVGEGAEAVPGARVKVHYVGVEFDTGEEFDSSWDRGEAIEFPLRGLIQGWQDGIPGMKVGGRRELTIPPAMAYGESGGHRLAGKTLVFVIDLLGVR